ncbi:MAG: hypothetical protein ACRDA3_13880 [Peptostreptococcaceae bacterium]
MYKKNVIVNCNLGRSNSLKLALEAHLKRMLAITQAISIKSTINSVKGGI